MQLTLQLSVLCKPTLAKKLKIDQATSLQGDIRSTKAPSKSKRPTNRRTHPWHQSESPYSHRYHHVRVARVVPAILKIGEVEQLSPRLRSASALCLRTSESLDRCLRHQKATIQEPWMLSRGWHRSPSKFKEKRFITSSLRLTRNQLLKVTSGAFWKWVYLAMQNPPTKAKKAPT